MIRALSITKGIHDWLYSIMSENVAHLVEMILIALVYLTIFAVAGLFLVLIESVFAVNSIEALLKFSPSVFADA